MFRTRWSIPDPAGPQIPPQGPQIHLRVPKFPLRARPQPHTSSRSSFGEDSDGFGFAPRGRRRHPEKSRWGCCRKGRGETPKSPPNPLQIPRNLPKIPLSREGGSGRCPMSLCCPCAVPRVPPAEGTKSRREFPELFPAGSAREFCFSGISLFPGFLSQKYSPILALLFPLQGLSHRSRSSFPKFGGVGLRILSPKPPGR